MDDKITEETVRELRRLFAEGRAGRPCPKNAEKDEASELRQCQMRARLREKMGTTGTPTGKLQLVPNCGSRHGGDDARYMTDAEARMYYYGRNIRAILDGKMSIAERPSAKLSAVPNCGSLLGARETEPPTGPSAA